MIHYAGLVALYLNDPLLRVLYSQLSHHQVKVSRPWTKRLYVYLVMPVWHVRCCHLSHPSHWTASCRVLITWLPTYTTFTFHNKWIMLSCQNQVLYIISSKAWPSYCYQSLNFSKFFCWLCTFVFLNTLACVFLLYYR
jgi:hypothetical protein